MAPYIPKAEIEPAALALLEEVIKDHPKLDSPSTLSAIMLMSIAISLKRITDVVMLSIKEQAK